MDTALPQKFPFILDRNLAKANCTENQVCTSCDTEVLGWNITDEMSKFVAQVTSGLLGRERNFFEVAS